MAAANPVSCLEFITTQFNIQPIHGINNKRVLIKAVTKTAPNPVFLASANPNAIFKKIACIAIIITITSIMIPISTGSANWPKKFIISVQPGIGAKYITYI